MMDLTIIISGSSKACQMPCDRFTRRRASLSLEWEMYLTLAAGGCASCRVAPQKHPDP